MAYCDYSVINNLNLSCLRAETGKLDPQTNSTLQSASVEPESKVSLYYF